MPGKVRILLNPKYVSKGGKKSIVIQLSINRKRTYFSLGYSVHPKDWNFKQNRLLKSYDPVLYKEINQYIEDELIRANTILRDLKMKEIPVTHENFKLRFRNKQSVNNVFDFFDLRIEEFKQQGKIGNSDNYRFTRNRLLKFRNDNRNLNFSEINVHFLEGFHTFLSKTCNENSISHHMRTLRALLNNAVGRELMEERFYPFKTPFKPRGYDISKLNTKTKKLALNAEDLKKIINYEVEENTRIKHSQDMFICGFYLMGMDFIDLSYLKWDDIYDGRVNYRRIKTGKDYSIKILPPVQNIFDKYELLQDGLPYVFKVFDHYHKTIAQKRTRVNTGLSEFNDDMTTIAERVGVKKRITSKVYRHSWATIMRRMDVSDSLISKGMKHSDEKTTQIYLDSLYPEQLDSMNEKLLNL